MADRKGAHKYIQFLRTSYLNVPLPGGESVEGAAALVCVDLVVVAVDEQRPARHVEEEAENAEQNVLGEVKETCGMFRYWSHGLRETCAYPHTICNQD